MKYCNASVKINFLFFNRLITTEISTMDHEDFESSCLMDGDVMVECTIVNNGEAEECGEEFFLKSLAFHSFFL